MESAAIVAEPSFATSNKATTLETASTTESAASNLSTQKVDVHGRAIAREKSGVSMPVGDCSEKIELSSKVDSVQTKKDAERNKTTSSSLVSSPERKDDGGNDRVTVDKKPNKPLVPESRSSCSNDNALQTSSKSDEILVASPASTTAAKKKKVTQRINRIEMRRSINQTNSRAVETETIPSANPTTASANASNNVESLPNYRSAAVGYTEDSTLSLDEEELQRQRSLLTEKYNPFITCSDTSLGDARRRLQIALDQTRQLRAAFTERIYGKYRICLQPPSQTKDIIKAINDDPKGMQLTLQQEIKRIKDEKHAEKRESHNSNNEGTVAPAVSTAASLTSRSPSLASDPTVTVEDHNNNTAASSNAENAEQLLYVSSGLSLIVLPEDDVSNIDMSMYRDRGPIRLTTGTRVQGISAAAATTGKAILERARLGKIARAEREKLSLKQVDRAHNFFDSNHYSKSTVSNRSSTAIVTNATTKAAKQPPMKPSTPTATNSPLLPSLKVHDAKVKITAPRSLATTTPKPTEGRKAGIVKRKSASKSSSKSLTGQTVANAKILRARVQATMSLNTLLNLNPIHEELRTDAKYSAATLAMMERGVGNYLGPTTQYHKNTPHRFKHPFPDSLGGRRRPVSTSGAIGNASPKQAASTESQGDPSQAPYLQLKLPPIPSVKDRRLHKKIKVMSTQKAATSRATSSIRKILDQFTSTNKTVNVTSEYCSKDTPENSSSLLGRPRKQRRISEIEFVRGLY